MSLRAQIQEMIKEGLETSLYEAFDKVLPYRWLMPEVAKASLPNGNMLLITFNEVHPNDKEKKIYEIEFSVNHNTSATGEGMQMEVFATVLKVIEDFTKKNKPKGYTFSAEKFAKERQDTRINLYKRLVKKFAPTIGMKADIDNQGYRAVFNLRRNNLSELKTSREFTVEARNIIDNHKGLGQVPMNVDVDYFGIRVMMKPSTFLQLAKPIRTAKEVSLDFIKNHLSNGGKIGAPFLLIQYKGKKSVVTGHEGRHRMMAVKEIISDTPIEVHLFVDKEDHKLRNRNLTDEIISDIRSGLYQESPSNTFRKGPLFKMM